MVKIIDFLLNIDFIRGIIYLIQDVISRDIILTLFGITCLFGIFGIILLIPVLIIFLINYFIIKRISISIYIISLIFTLTGIILLIILTLTTIKNEKIEVIEPNRNKRVIVLVGEKSKFKNFPKRIYISLTKEYTLKKIGLDKYIDIEKVLEFDNYELNQLIEKIDRIIDIEKNIDLSIEEKKYFKEKLIVSNDIDEIFSEIYYLIKEKKEKILEEKKKESLYKQKIILENSINLWYN